MFIAYIKIFEGVYELNKRDEAKNLSEFLSSINTERNNLIASGIESFTEERKQEILKKYDDLISSWQEALNKAKIKEKDKYYVDEENLLDRIVHFLY